MFICAILFDEMRVVDSGLTRRKARNFEGSALHHANSGRGQYNGTLQNELRPTTPGYYHSYTDPPGKGKKLLTNSEVELKTKATLDDDSTIVPP